MEDNQMLFVANTLSLWDIALEGFLVRVCSSYACKLCSCMDAGDFRKMRDFLSMAATTFAGDCSDVVSQPFNS